MVRGQHVRTGLTDIAIHRCAGVLRADRDHALPDNVTGIAGLIEHDHRVAGRGLAAQLAYRSAAARRVRAPF